MKGKAIPLSVLVVGALLVVAGVVLKFAIVPALAQFPDDVDTTRTYGGTVTILNQSVLTDPSQPPFFTDLPVISTRTVTTEEVDGRKALVRDKADLNAAPGTPIAGVRLTGFDDYYTIDRKSMQAIENFTGDDRVLPNRQGLVVGFPIGTEDRDYPGWNGDPQTPVTLKFVREEERGGIDTYVFTASSGPLAIKDPGTLGEFPNGIPREAVEPLLPALNLPSDIAAALPQLLPLLPETIPLSYTYEFEATYWIDPITGILIDIEKNDIRKAEVQGLPIPLDPIEVYNLRYTPTQESLVAAVDDAKDNGRLLQLGETTGPIGLWTLGGIAIVAGAFLLLRRRPDEEPAVEPHHVGDLAPDQLEA